MSKSILIPYRLQFLLLPPYQTMDLSTMTMPIALLILAVMVSNVRLVICTVISLLACLAGSILIMLPITKVMTV